MRARYIVLALLMVVMAGAIVVGQPRGLLTDSRPPTHKIDVLVVGGVRLG